MSAKASNHRGLLFWVDDNFYEQPLDIEDLWLNVFGGLPDAVFRLMNLEVRTARSYREAMDALPELQRLQETGVQVFSLLDLSIPRNETEKEHHSIHHGVKLAKAFIAHGMEFVFLTTNQNAETVLADQGLSATPYFNKQSSRQRIPENLVRQILGRFSAGIHWVFLQQAIEQLHGKSNTLGYLRTAQGDLSLAARVFPYFPPFQDFVDEWERQPPLDRGATVLMRCASAHCDAFVNQCLLVALNSLIDLHPEHVRLMYGWAHDGDFVNLLREIQDESMLVNALRVDPDQTDLNALQSIMDGFCSEDIVLLLLPDDERSENYLDELRFGTVRATPVYRDLPNIRPGHDFARHQLIRRSVDLVFQNERLEGRCEMNAVYLHYPEVLMNPVSWVALLESTEVHELLSDPFEVLGEFETMLRRLLASDHRDTLTNRRARPPAIEQLYEVSTERLQLEAVDMDSLMQHKWLPDALDYWLSRCWQYPYDLSGDPNRRVHIPTDEREQWEDFSVVVLQSLARRWDRHQYQPGERDRYDWTPIAQAVEFLEQAAMLKLVQGRADEITTEDWDEMMGVRWPHRNYPFPAALNRMVKQAGRYLWIQSDNLGLSHLFPSGKLLYSHLDDVAEQIQQRLLWLHQHTGSQGAFPLEWREPMAALAGWLEDDEVSRVWKREPDVLHDTLIGLADNALPLMHICHGVLTGTSLDVIGKQLKNAGGHGVALSYLEQARKQVLFRVLRQSPEAFTQSQRVTLENLAQHLRGDMGYSQWHQRQKQVDALIGPSRFAALSRGLKTQGRQQLCELLNIDKLDSKSYRQVFAALNAEARLRLAELWQQLGRVELQAPMNIWQGLEQLLGHVSASVGQSMDGQADTGPSVHAFYEHLTAGLNEDSGLFERVLDLDSVGRLRGKKIDAEHEAYPDPSFFLTPLDMAVNALEVAQLLKMVLHNFSFIDGYHLMAMIFSMRNRSKQGMSLVEKEFLATQRIFELFIYSAEGMAAQLKLLLELSDRQDLAEKIRLYSVEPLVLPEQVERPDPAELANLLKIEETAEGFHVYHLGFPGSDTQDELCVNYGGGVQILGG